MMMMMNEGPPLLSPTFPPPQALQGGTQTGASLNKRLILRKTVEYHATSLRYLQNRLWQRDRRDMPVIQPDSTYYNDVPVPAGLSDYPVNVVTTKFVKACTNKTRSPIFCTSWVPDGRRLVTGAASGEFTLWNGVNFNFESIIQAHDCSMRTIDWSHNGKWMVTADDRGFIKYWQINFNNVHTYQAHSEPIRSTSFSPTDAKLATCSDDGTIRVFDFLSCTEEHILRGHGADVKCLDWHPRRSLLASGSKDNQQPVKLWDAKTGQSVCTIHAHKATVMDIKWNRNGNWLATASRDYLIKVYDVRMMRELYVLKGHKKDVNTISWHPVHEKVFASGGSDGAILFWLVGNEREIGGMEAAHVGFVWSLSWHPLGHLLCSGANDHTCKFWCRNRPGEELKDKYNSFNNPFFLGDEMEMPGNLPGMNVMDQPGVGGGGMDPLNLMLPPPSREAITLPPPSAASPWRQGGGESLHVLPGPRVDVPILGADIIAQTFDDNKNKDDVLGRGDGTFEKQDGPPGPPRPLLGNNPLGRNFHEDQEELWERPGHFGGPHPPHPLPPPHPPPPDEMGGSRFNWHRYDYQPRRPSFDEERWNPFVYRRDVNGPPRGPPPGPPGQRRDSQEFYRPMPPQEEFGNRPRDYLPPPDRQFDRPPPPGDRQFDRPPPGDQQFDRPPPPGERNFIPQFDRPPPPGDRQFDHPQFDRPPPLPGDRKFERLPGPGDHQFDRLQPHDDRYAIPPPRDRFLQFDRPPPPVDRQFDRPPADNRRSGDNRQFERPPPPGPDRQFERPPGERAFERPPQKFDQHPPPPGERQFPQFDHERPFEGPPGGDRHFERPPGDRNFDRPPGDRNFDRPPPGDRQFEQPPPSVERGQFPPEDYARGPPQAPPGDRQYGNLSSPLILSGGDRGFSHKGRDNPFPPPQDPRQAPPPPPQDDRKSYQPSDPRQRGSSHNEHFGYSHAPLNYKPPETFQDDRPRPQYDSGSGGGTGGRRDYQGDGGQYNGPSNSRDSNFLQDPRQGSRSSDGNFSSHKQHPSDPRQRGGSQETHSPSYAPPTYRSGGRDQQYKPPPQDRQFDGRDPRFERGSGSSYRDSDRRRDDHDDRRRDSSGGGRTSKSKDDPRSGRHGRGDDKEAPPTKKSKRDQLGDTAGDSSSRSSSSRQK